MVDQGAHLEAIQQQRASSSSTTTAPKRLPKTCARWRAAPTRGRRTSSFLALKAYVVEAVAPQMRALFGDDTIVVPIQNGLPWWYFQNFSGPHAGYRLKTADPNGVIEQNIESRRHHRLRRLSRR